MYPSIPTPEELQSLLVKRLNLSEEEEQTFLAPQYGLGSLNDFTDMESAIDRIYTAVKNKEQIGIYADYDCDGIPAAVILTDLFTLVNARELVEVYIPDRHDEGYGMSMIGVNVLAEKGVSLIVTVDLGISAVREVAEAQARGIDVIVTDHHAPPAGGPSMYPAAHAIVHPAKSSYRNSDPCGAGMAFYLACAFLEKYGKEFGVVPGSEKWMLDLVAFATLSDMVPLVGENRTLVTYGMMVMRKTRRVGIRMLFSELKLDPTTLTETDLTFSIAPRLNAASRMSTPLLAFELLSTSDMSRALVIIKELEKINTERKLLVARIVKEAHKKLEARELPPIVVLGDLSWRPAVLGLVANKLQEAYERSFFVWGESGDGYIKGSCRMLDEHHAAHLFHALPEGVVLHAGGHQAAGGFAVAKDKIHFFEQELNSAIEKVVYENNEKVINEPVPMPLAIASVRHLQKIRTMAPFGVGNIQPCFLFREVTVLDTKLFGKNKEHLECTLRDETGKAVAFTFFVDEKMKESIVPGALISVSGALEAGWRGGVRIRIQNILPAYAGGL